MEQMALGIQRTDRGGPARSARARQNLLLLLPLAFLVVARLVYRAGQPPVEVRPLLDAVGLPLLLAGLWLRICGRQWKAERSALGLVTDGLYASFRHPLYVGSFLMGLGLCLLLGDWVLLAVFVPAFWLSHGLVIRREEAGLESEFGGQYREYRRRVPAIIPRLGPLPRRIVPDRVEEAVVREGDSLCLALGLPLAVRLAEWLARDPGALSGPLAGYPLVLLLGLGALAFLWVRLKTEYRELVARERECSVSRIA